MGFDWPGEAARLADELARAEPRERGDLVRLLGGMPSDTAVAAVLAACADPTPAIRAEALRAVARLKPTEARGTVRAALSDKEPSVRAAAIATLVALSDAGAHEQLARALGDTESSVRAAAARALGMLAPSQQLAALIAALDDLDVSVRVAALFALSRSDEERARWAVLTRAIDPAPEVRAAALRAAARFRDPRSVPLFVRAVQDPVEDVAVAAVLALTAAPAEHTEDTLEPLTRSPRTRVAQAARAGLERISREREDTKGASAGEPAWLGWLTRTQDASQEPEAVIDGLERSLPQGEALAAMPLTLFLPRVPPPLRPRAIALIARAGGRDGLPTLTALLDAGDAPSRRAAAQALATLGTRAEARALLAHLDDPDPDTRRALALSLSRIASPGELDSLLARASGRGEGRDAAVLAVSFAAGRIVRELPPRARPRLDSVLKQALHGEDPARAQIAARGLGTIGDAAATRMLAEMGSAQRVGRVVGATRALALSDSPEALAGLRARLDDPLSQVRATSVAALGLRGTRDDVARITEAARRGPWPLGPVTAFALASLVLRNEIASDVLCTWLASKEPISRHNAAMALAARPSATCPLGEDPPILPTTDATPTQPASSWVALRLADGRMLLSHVDETGDASFAPLSRVSVRSAWRWPYGIR